MFAAFAQPIHRYSRAAPVWHRYEPSRINNPWRGHGLTPATHVEPAMRGRANLSVLTLVVVPSLIVAAAFIRDWLNAQ
jgi:hypothetical protein